MRKRTRGSSDIARHGQDQQQDLDMVDPVVWLPSKGVRPKPRRFEAASRALSDAVEQSGTHLSRATLVIGMGCAASGAVSNSALAPVGPAHAAIGRMIAPPPASLAIEIDPRSVFAPSAEERSTRSFDDRRSEVEEFLRFGSRDLPRRLVETVVRAADATGVDAIYLMALADKESSFRPDVKAATSSAQGLFQFIDRTWLEMVRVFGPRHGLQAEAALVSIADGRPGIVDEVERARVLDLRRNPYVAAVMAAELLKRDAAQIGFRIGRTLNRTELYLAHFLGLEDAARFIELRGRKRAPKAAKAFPAAARSNAGIFFEAQKRGRRGLSVGEVYAKIDRMMASRAERYQDVKLQTAASNGS